MTTLSQLLKEAEEAVAKQADAEVASPPLIDVEAPSLLAGAGALGGYKAQTAYSDSRIKDFVEHIAKNKRGLQASRRFGANPNLGGAAARRAGDYTRLLGIVNSRFGKNLWRRTRTPMGLLAAVAGSQVPRLFGYGEK